MVLSSGGLYQHFYSEREQHVLATLCAPDKDVSCSILSGNLLSTIFGLT